MKKIISFSLWGWDTKYTVGALKNAELAKSIYPGWICRFYVASSVPKIIIDQLKAMNHVEVVEKGDAGDWRSTLWRFDAGCGNDYEVVIFRDTDSRLNLREKAAVDQWLASDKKYHIMRDHPYHQSFILAGMWGMKSSQSSFISANLDIFKESDKVTDFYGVDQLFLANIYHIIVDISMIHDPFYSRIPFPTKRENSQFVGQVFLADESTSEEHIGALNSVEIT